MFLLCFQVTAVAVLSQSVTALRKASDSDVTQTSSVTTEASDSSSRRLG